MRIYCFVLLSIGLLTSCSAPEDQAGSSTRAALPDSIEIPEHIRQLDSLAVFGRSTPPRYGIRFEEEVTYEGVPMNFAPSLGGFGPDIAVDDSGRVYRINRQRKNIQIRNPDGSLRGTLGRQGRGPGEFVDLTSIMVLEDRLYAYDPNQIRVQVFTLNPAELDRVVNLEPQEFSGEGEVGFGRPVATFYPLEGGHLLAGISGVEREEGEFTGYYVLSPEGELASGKIVELMRRGRIRFTSERGAAASTQLPAGREGIMDVSDDGTIYQANTGEFLIRVFDVEEGYRGAIWYPYENDPVETSEMLDRYSGGLYDRFPKEEIPGTWPALEKLFVDDENRVWVSTVTDDKEIRQWWVLSGDGELLARFSWNSEESLETVRDGHLYVRVSEGEGFDIDRKVVRYRFTLESPTSPETMP